MAVTSSPCARSSLEVGVLPRTHGSALFTRGETQAIVVTTLGTGDDEQLSTGWKVLQGTSCCTTTSRPTRSVRPAAPARPAAAKSATASWHGAPSTRCCRPSLTEFPYTLRVVSEITESNGSSSMATVCGTSLALMDAGVPLKAPVAGIAMGLIKEGDEFAVLSDILGDEDHLGDMDFKVAGTENGITSLQMDIKIDGITEEIMQIALGSGQGRPPAHPRRDGQSPGRSRASWANSPRASSMNIPVDKIRDVIGTGGKVIREIVEKTGAKINIDDDGTIKIASPRASRSRRPRSGSTRSWPSLKSARSIRAPS
jgi:polyribonucleotide nucleotidyltransferase